MCSDLNLIRHHSYWFGHKATRMLLPAKRATADFKKYYNCKFTPKTMVECHCYYLRSYRTRQLWWVVVNCGKLVVNNSNLDLKTCRFQSFRQIILNSIQDEDLCIFPSNISCYVSPLIYVYVHHVVAYNTI